MLRNTGWRTRRQVVHRAGIESWEWSTGVVRFFTVLHTRAAKIALHDATASSTCIIDCRYIKQEAVTWISDLPQNPV
jgi:hypothetical protein